MRQRIRPRLDEQVAVRLSTGELDALRELAKDEDRSLACVIRRACRRALAARDEEALKGTPPLQQGR
jgi:hypothetical protein